MSKGPIGSTETEPSGTDDGSSRCTINSRSSEAPSLPKPNSSEEVDWLQYLPGILEDSKEMNNEQILANLKMVAEALAKKCRSDYWLTDKGQAELLRRAQEGASDLPWRKKTGINTAAQLNELSYTTSSRSFRVESCLSPVSPNDEWFEIDLTAD